MKRFLTMLSACLLFACSQNGEPFTGEYVMLNAPEGAEITLGFNGNDFYGVAAINNYFGSYTRKTNGAIKFNTVGSTMMAGPRDLMDAESKYLNNLERINSYKTDGDKLILSGKGQTLTFKRKQ